MGEIDLDGGGVDMYTELLEALLARLRNVGGRLEEESGVDLDSIAGLEQLLGKGPMGRAYALEYNPSAESLKGAIEQACLAPPRRARSATVTVNEYKLGDALGQQAFET
jgi:hypothetical protein